MESFFVAETLKYLLLLEGDAAATAAAAPPSGADEAQASPTDQPLQLPTLAAAPSQSDDGDWEALLPAASDDATASSVQAAPWLFDGAASAWEGAGGSPVLLEQEVASGDARRSRPGPLGDSRTPAAVAALQLLPLDEWVLNTEAHPLRRWPAVAA
jgi:hypothetical protein